MRRADGRPRVTLFQPYWDFWEAAVPFDLRADRDRLAAEVRSRLDVDWVKQEQAECVLVLETMASPPAWTLAELGDLPLVVWAAHRHARVEESFDHTAITTEGSVSRIFAGMGSADFHSRAGSSSIRATEAKCSRGARRSFATLRRLGGPTEFTPSPLPLA